MTFYEVSYFQNKSKNCGPNRELNPGPLAPEARIIPLDHLAAGGKRPLARAQPPREQLCVRRSITTSSMPAGGDTLGFKNDGPLLNHNTSL